MSDLWDRALVIARSSPSEDVSHRLDELIREWITQQRIDDRLQRMAAGYFG